MIQVQKICQTDLKMETRASTNIIIGIIITAEVQRTTALSPLRFRWQVTQAGCRVIKRARWAKVGPLLQALINIIIIGITAIIITTSSIDNQESDQDLLLVGPRLKRASYRVPMKNLKSTCVVPITMMAVSKALQP